MSASTSSKGFIPNSLKKTIQNLKEIVKNHSDEEIHAMLKDCNMDPNETVQRLLLQDWSSINDELLDLIMKRLDLIEFIRAGAVCQSWRSTMKTCSPPKSHTPWLILSSPHQPDFRYARNLAVDLKSLYKFNLPNLKYHYIVGSSHGFIISVDEICQIHATNPITGSHRLLPPIATLPCCEGAVRDPITNQISHYLIRDAPSPTNTPVEWDVDHAQKYFYHKVALFPTSSSAGLISVLIHNLMEELAFARQSDESWTCIQPSLVNFEDALFYKGLLYAVDCNSGLFAYDVLNYSASSEPVIHREGWVEKSDGKRYLVQSPCGSDLFLIYRVIGYMVAHDDGDIPIQTESFKIYKLNQDCYQWSEVSSFGTDAAVVFLGFSPSVMLLAKDIPSIAANKGDCIFFTHDDSLSFSRSEMQKTLDMGIFYLEDKRIVPSDIINDHPQQFNHPPPFWFTPVTE